MSRRRLSTLLVVGAAVAPLCSPTASGARVALRTGAPARSKAAPPAHAAATRPKPFKLPRVRHVFVIMLENESAAKTFEEPAADPYLAETLPSQGALLQNYYATGHESNDNYISIVSGQPPNVQNQADCQIFDNFIGGLMLEDGVEAGTGCVYPAEVNNIGTQLSSRKKSWKDYDQDMGNIPTRESAACGHPALESRDETQTAVEGDGYAARHNPFIYFHSVIDEPKFCDKHVVALGGSNGEMPAGAIRGETGLATDLLKAGTTPVFSWITPNLCEDGHDFPCTNEPSGASALTDVDRFLEAWVPKITSSPAFQRNGLLEITFDEGEDSDASSCCEELPGPGSPLPGITGLGGGRVGAVLLSPFINPGTVVTSDYNHYSSLGSWETLLGLPRLADAASVPSTFGADVFTAPGA